MRALESEPVRVIAWCIGIAIVLFTGLGSAALVQSQSRSDQDVCISHGGSFSYDSTSHTPNGWKEECRK